MSWLDALLQGPQGPAGPPGPSVSSDTLILFAVLVDIVGGPTALVTCLPSVDFPGASVANLKASLATDTGATAPSWTLASYSIGDIVRSSSGNLYVATRAGATTGPEPAGYPGMCHIASGSNGAVLPQSTIYVDDTSTLDTAGDIYLPIATGGSDHDRVISYTGKTANTLTGCTGGIGTMATGQLAIGTFRDGGVWWRPTIAQFTVGVLGAMSPLASFYTPYQLGGLPLASAFDFTADISAGLIPLVTRTILEAGVGGDPADTHGYTHGLSGGAEIHFG